MGVRPRPSVQSNWELGIARASSPILGRVVQTAITINIRSGRVPSDDDGRRTSRRSDEASGERISGREGRAGAIDNESRDTTCRWDRGPRAKREDLARCGLDFERGRLNHEQQLREEQMKYLRLRYLI